MIAAKPGQPFLVTEPQSEGVGHASFNAAYLHMIALALHEYSITFRAAKGHIDQVRPILVDHAPELAASIVWEEIPPYRGSAIQRLLSTIRTLRAALKERRVLFTSLSKSQLHIVGRLIRLSPRARAAAIVHGDLDLLVDPAASEGKKWHTSYAKFYSHPTPERLMLLYLGQTIFDNIPAKFRGNISSSFVGDMPYHFEPETPRTPGPVRFGCFGGLGDAVYLEAFARALRALGCDAPISVIGFVSSQAVVDRLSGLVEHAAFKPVDRPEFLRLAREIDYSVWLKDGPDTKLRASATLFDCMSVGAPILSIPNEFMDSYFIRYPELGSRCAGPEEAAAVAAKLAAAPDAVPPARAAVYALRQNFTPAALAPALREALLRHYRLP